MEAKFEVVILFDAYDKDDVRSMLADLDEDKISIVSIKDLREKQ